MRAAVANGSAKQLYPIAGSTCTYLTNERSQLLAAPGLLALDCMGIWSPMADLMDPNDDLC